MNALVLYDSRYGNTERIAETVALVVQLAMPTRLATVEEAAEDGELLRDLDLLLVGGPTHRHGISDPLEAVLTALDPRALDDVRAATFDTRLHGMRLVTGSAAVRLGRLLRRRGAWLVPPPASFVVDGTVGPLRDGEIEHARAWTEDVLRCAGVRGRAPSEAAAAR